MKTRVCPECGQWNGHYTNCPETPEPVELEEEDPALDELEAKEHEKAMWWPKPHWYAEVAQEIDEE